MPKPDTTDEERAQAARILDGLNRVARRGEEAQRETARCARDPWYFITTYCRTFDNEDAQEKPFPKWQFLEELCAKIVPDPKHKAGDVLKSRRVMVSWLFMACFLWALRFKPWPMLAMSEVAEKADDGGSKSTWNSLHGKIRFMYDRLPTWLKVPLSFKQGQISNPQSGAVVDFPATSDSPSRSGGYYLGIADEFAHVPHSEVVLSALTFAVEHLWLVSTPKGRTNAFGRIADSDSDATEYHHMRIHWKQRPDRDEYAARKKRDLAPHIYEQEMELSLDARTPNSIFYNFDAALHAKVRVPYLPGVPLVTLWDFGTSSQTAISWMQVEWVNVGGNLQPRLRFPRCRVDSEKPDSYFADVLKEGNRELCGDELGSRNYGDPSGWGKQTERDRITTRVQNLLERGVYLEQAPVHGMEHEDLFNALRTFLEFRDPVMVLIDPVDAEDLAWALEAYPYKTNRDGVRTGPDKLHTASHASDTAIFGAVLNRNWRTQQIEVDMSPQPILEERW